MTDHSNDEKRVKKPLKPGTERGYERRSDDGDIWELIKTALLAVFLALVIRTFAVEPFNIPSGSMLPTLQVGDYLFVSKYSYGYGRYSFPFNIASFEGRIMMDAPKRGDVAVFRLPKDPSIDYIKRIIGLPGDRVQVQDGILYINDAPVTRERIGLEQIEDGFGRLSSHVLYRETLPNGVKHAIIEKDDESRYDNTAVFVVPEGHFFAMGDNRDGSQDSRAISMVGFIPMDNLIGRAEFIFFSTNGSASLMEVWKWPTAIRWNRLFKDIP